MFEGKAEEAMNFYVSVIPRSEVIDVVRYGPGGPGAEGSVLKATFSVAGQTVMCIDSPVSHAFTFTPSFSFFVECESEDELRQLAGALGESGQTFMPLDNYGFSRLFTWVGDRFGISWQLNLA
jgi:predicted 3-demethylubiquinone-9 3-methyltransferase (glyoxalase superfamily)